MSTRQRTLSALLGCGLICSCSSTPDALEADKGAAVRTVFLSGNYQEIYRRVYGAASRCMVANNSSTRLDVEAQLYSELGFGEITASMASIYGKGYYLKAKIEKAGNGSKLTAHSTNGLARERTAEKVVAWANGDSSC